VKEKAPKKAIKQTELERLQNELVGGPKAAGKSKKRTSDAKVRMMKGARNASGPINARSDWRWAGG